MHATLTLEPIDRHASPGLLDSGALDTGQLQAIELHAGQVDAGPAVRPRLRARCADVHGTLSALFFSDDVVDIARAKAICAKCALAPSCLDGALRRAEPWGVWGGELLENGRIVVHKRPRGRPPKHPRPQLVIDEVPLPPHRVA